MEQHPQPSEEPIEAPAAVVRWEEPVDEVPGVTGFVARASRLGLGLAGLAVGATTDAIERLGPAPGPQGATLRRLPSAALGIGLAASERVLAVSAQLEASAGSAIEAVRHLPVVGAAVAAGDRSIERWSARGAEEQAGNAALLGEFVQRLVPEVAAAVVERLDLDAIIATLPLDTIMASIDVDAIVARVDVDAIVARVDLDALMGRVDIGPITERALDAVDIGEIVRESTGSVTGGLVDTTRVQSMQLDTIVNRIVDTVLLRRRHRRAQAGRDWEIGGTRAAVERARSAAGTGADPIDDGTDDR